MGKILDALFEGNLFVEPLTEKRSPEDQKLVETSYALLDELAQKLSREEEKMLIKAVDALNLESERYAKDRFSRGYCLGILMTLEVIEKWDDFFVPQRR